MTPLGQAILERTARRPACVSRRTGRGAAVGVYRLWRDIGLAVGALLAGVVADVWSLTTAIVVVALITAASGLDIALRRRETFRPLTSA